MWILDGQIQTAIYTVVLFKFFKVKKISANPLWLEDHNDFSKIICLLTIYETIGLKTAFTAYCTVKQLQNFIYNLETEKIWMHSSGLLIIKDLKKNYNLVINDSCANR